jgi:hypothetical protein
MVSPESLMQLQCWVSTLHSAVQNFSEAQPDPFACRRCATDAAGLRQAVFLTFVEEK